MLSATMTRDRGTESALSQTRAMSQTCIDEPAQLVISHSACLIFIAGERLGRKLDLGGGDLVVGRDRRCGLTIHSDLVSRNHAKFKTSGETTILLDLASTNGTFVNDERILERTLRDGDRVAIGKVVMKYLGHGSAEVGYHEEVYKLVSHDGLTEVYNKRFFEEQLASETMSAHDHISIIVFDVDHFKNVNDTFGHAAGDAVLRQLASCARGCAMESAVLARIGGEEFSVLMPNASLSKAVAMADAIRQAVDEHVFTFGDLIIPVTVSLGVASSPPGMPMGGQELFKLADEKLYLAKQSGRNCVCA